MSDTKTAGAAARTAATTASTQSAPTQTYYSQPVSVTTVSEAPMRVGLPWYAILMQVIFIIFIPPLAVFLGTGSIFETIINLVLLLLGIIPGWIHAILVCATACHLSCFDPIITPPPVYRMCNRLDRRAARSHTSTYYSTAPAVTTTYPTTRL